MTQASASIKTEKLPDGAIGDAAHLDKTGRKRRRTDAVAHGQADAAQTYVATKSRDGRQGNKSARQSIHEDASERRMDPRSFKESTSFVNSRGQRLHMVAHLPEGVDDGAPPTCVVVFHHGLGGYIDRYDNVFSKISGELNAAVYAYDAHGHGLSEPYDDKHRCYFEKFEHLTDDLSQFLKEVVQPRSGNLPVFVGGTSLGALVATHTAATHQDTLAGLLYFAAAIDVHWTPTLRILSTVVGLASIIAPSSQLIPPADSDGLSQDSELVEAHLRDPLVYNGPLRARPANEIIKGFNSVQKLRSDIKLPVFAIHGTDDTRTPAKAVRRYLSGISSKEKAFVEVEGAKHLILLGPERDEVVERAVRWMEARVGKSARLNSKPWWENFVGDEDTDTGKGLHKEKESVFHLPASKDEDAANASLGADAYVPWWDRCLGQES